MMETPSTQGIVQVQVPTAWWLALDESEATVVNQYV